MNKIFLSFITALLLCSSARAQIAKWIIPPRYEHIQLMPGTNVYKGGISDSTYLWNLKGERLLGTKFYVGPFADNVAVVAEGNQLRGIVTTKGRYYSFSNITPSYEIDTKCPLFSCGYLLVKQEGSYYYLNKEGEPVLGPFGEACPFSQGMAAVLTYENPEKKKGEYYALIRDDQSQINFQVNNKVVDNGNVKFCSSLNDQKKAIVVIKKDVYLFDSSDNSLTHLSTDGTDNKKNYLQLTQSDVIKTQTTEGAFTIEMNKGELSFDKYCLLTKIDIPDAGKPQLFEKDKLVERAVEKQLAINSSADGATYGVDYLNGDNKKQTILPPQFSDVSDIIATNAVVCSKEKYGVVTVDFGSKFNFTLNNGNDIGFAHGKYPSNIQVSLPSYVSWQNAVMTASKEDRCEILPVSRTGADTREGNYLRYDCNLFIPDGLTENRADKDYHFSVNYDGLQSPSYAVNSKIWYIQQYEVNVEKQGVKEDTIWVQVNVHKKADVETDNGFWFNVDVSSPDTHISKSSKKIDENTYIFKIFDVPEGTCEISIDVNEDNCPPIRFPYSMNYKMASGRVGGAVSFVKKEK